MCYDIITSAFDFLISGFFNILENGKVLFIHLVRSIWHSRSAFPFSQQGSISLVKNWKGTLFVPLWLRSERVKLLFHFPKCWKKPEMRKSNALVTVSQCTSTQSAHSPIHPFTHLWGSGRQRYGGAVYSGRSYLAAIVIEKKLRNILNITHEWSTVVVRKKSVIFEKKSVSFEKKVWFLKKKCDFWKKSSSKNSTSTAVFLVKLNDNDQTACFNSHIPVALPSTSPEWSGMPVKGSLSWRRFFWLSETTWT